MALRKNIALTGKASMQAENINVQLGEQSVSKDFYVKVGHVFGDKETMQATVLFSADDISFSKGYGFALDLNGGNPIKQCYDHLKTLPEFAGAVDC